MHPWPGRTTTEQLCLGTLAVASCLGLVFGAAGVADGLSPSPHHARVSLSSRHRSKHKPQKGTSGQGGHGPCLEGDWNVTSITLRASGLTFTGGAGTTVDIMSDGNALGDFTPGAPLTGTEGSAKFNGTITDHYGFAPKTTSHSGSFPVSTVSDEATITVAGITKPVTSSPEQGSYSCTGKDLSLTFTSGDSTLMYQMTPG